MTAAAHLYPTATMEFAMSEQKIRIRIPLLSKEKDAPFNTMVLRVPPEMDAQSAIVTKTDEGAPVLFWAGLRRVGMVGTWTTLGAAKDLGDARVLVQDGDLWVIAIFVPPDPDRHDRPPVWRPLAPAAVTCVCGAAGRDRLDGSDRGPCQNFPACLPIQAAAM